jgi:antitoxin HigA-1
MIPLGLSANALSRDIDVPPNRITSIIAAERAVTPDTALRLARYFDTTPEFWLNLQMAHDLSVAVVEHGAEINERIRPRAA